MLLGARAFQQHPPLAREVVAVLNFEARGNGGPSMMFEPSAGNAGLISLLAEVGRPAVATSLSQEVCKRLPNDTDFTELKAARLGLNFAQSTRSVFSFIGSLLTAAWDATLASSASAWGNNEATAILKEAEAKSKGIAKENEALAGAGGRTMVKLRIAEALQGKQIIFMPSGHGGATLQMMDMNQILTQYAASRSAQASSGEQ